MLILILIQTVYFTYQNFKIDAPKTLVVDNVLQREIDSLKSSAIEKKVNRIYPFNPNFITDYKGYTLGMSIEEIDRLHTFRSEDKFVNSVEEFQRVTGVSDSLLNRISVNFKFPEWTQKSSTSKTGKTKFQNSIIEGGNSNLLIKDLNSATAEELKTIYGIGEKLSGRIIKFRDRLGGFLVDSQLYDVYGLEPEVAERALKHFRVIEMPEIEKINLNLASVQEISKLVYLQRSVAQGIVDYRNLNGSINSFDELSKIENFPIDKIDNIALYLSLKK